VWSSSAEKLTLSGTGGLDVNTATGSVNIQAGNASADIALGVGSPSTANKVVVTAGGNVGIGTALPTNGKLVIEESGTSVGSTIRLIGTNTSGSASQVSHITSYQPAGGSAEASALDFKVRGTDPYATPSTVMTLLGGGNVGIGTSSPQTPWITGAASTLSVVSSAKYTGLDIKSYSTSFNHCGALALGHSKSATINTQAATTTGDFIGSVSFEGVNSSSAVTAGAYISAEQTGVAGATHIPSALKFSTSTGAAAATERMRIDSSGNLLVGTTSTSASVAGGRIFSTGRLVTSVNNEGHYFRRNSSDGTIVEFAKDGTTVGCIGTDSGDLTIYSTVAGHTGFRFGNSEVYPTNNGGSLSDNTMSLGSNSIRFKDLYLSGGVVFGTTGGSVTSKTLDDYEEGTWTPVYTANSGAATHTVQTGSYVKVGKLVTVIGELQASRNTLSGAVTITGLPFASSGNGGGFNPTFTIRFASDMPNLKGYTSASSIVLKTQATSSTNSVNVIETDLSNTATNHNYLYFTATYMTA
jgi:hypothetical protein